MTDSNDIEYYYHDSKQNRLENVIRQFQHTTDESLFDNINIYKFSYDDVTVELEGVPRLCQAVLRVVTIDKIDLQKFQTLFERFYQQTNKEEYQDVLFERLNQLVQPFINPQTASVGNDWIKQRNVCLLLALVMGKFAMPSSFNIGKHASLIPYLSRIFNYVFALDASSVDCYLKEAVLYALITLEKLAIVHYFNVRENKKDRQIIEMQTELINKLKSDFEKQELVLFLEANIVSLKNALRYEFNKKMLTKLKTKLNNLLLKYNVKGPLGNPEFQLIEYQIGFFAQYCLKNVMDERYFADPDLRVVYRQFEPPLNLFAYLQYALNPSITADDFMAKISSDGLSARNYKLNKYHFVPVRSLFEVSSGVHFYEVTLITGGSMRIGWSTVGSELMEEPKTGIGEDELSIGFDGHAQSVWHQVEYKVTNVPQWNEGDVVGCLINVHEETFAFYLNGEEVAFHEKTYFSSLPYFATVSLSPHQQCYFNFGQSQFEFPPTAVKYKSFHASTSGNNEKYRIIAPILDANKCYHWEDPTLANNVLFDANKQKEFQQIAMKILRRTIDQNELKEFFKINSKIILKHGFLILTQILSSPQVYRCNTLLEYFSILLSNFSPFHFRQLSIELFHEPTKIPLPMKELSSLFFETMRYSKYESNADRLQLNIFLKIVLTDFVGIDILQDEGEVEVIGLLKTIKESQQLGHVLWSVILLEYIVVTKPHLLTESPLNEFIIEALKERAHKDNCSLTKFTKQRKPADFLNYQIGFCAQWTLENVIKQNLKTFKYIKYSSSEMSIRNENYGIKIIRTKIESVFGLSYYEVTLITSGYMQFGWSTRQCDLTIAGAGVDKYSISIDHCQTIRHQSKCLQTGNLVCLKPGDVIGCLADSNIKKFYFFINGMQIHFEGEIYFSNQPYYAIASICQHQHCYFNFGKEPFSFPPDGIKSNYLYLSEIRKSKIQFQESKFYLKLWAWFEQELDQVFFQDKTQDEFYCWFNELERKIIEKSYRFVQNASKDLKLENDFKELMQNDQAELRLFQTLVEKLGISKEIDEITIEHIFASVMHNFMSLRREVSFPLTHLHEMIYPISIMQNCDSNHQLYCRNICMIIEQLTSIHDWGKRTTFELYNICFNFLVETIATSNDNLTLLYAIICIENFYCADINENPIREQKWGRLYELAKLVQPFDPYNFNVADLVHYEIGFCANWFLQKITQTSPIISPEQGFVATLDPNCSTNDTKFSPDLLSVRCDRNFQFVKSTFSTLNKNVYYYEAVLLTSGSMLIGWSAKYEDNLETIDNCVGFNGYDQTVLYFQEKHSLELERNWKVGDVLGSLIDVGKHKFAFFLNGEQIWNNRADNILDKFPDFYQAAVTLEQKQQCYVNFGQLTFKHSPKLRFHDFNGNIYNDDLCQLCYVRRDEARSSCGHVKICIQCIVDKMPCPEC